MGKNSTEPAFTFKSTLKTGAERFLAQSLAHAQAQGFRTPDDFLRHFKPLDLMVALESAHDLRADILVKAAGVHQKIAIKKSTASGAEDLRIAIEEGLTDAAAILELFPPDDRVRYLDAPRLWSFLVEDEFWSTLNAEANRERAIGRMTFTLENALREDLLSLADIADGITFEMLATRLPHKELQKLVSHALKLGRERKPLTEEALLDSVPLQSIVGYVPLEHVWKQVVVERVAKPAGFLATPAAAPTPPEPEEKPAPVRLAAPAPPAKEEASAESRKSVPPPKPPSGPPRKQEDSLAEMAAAEDDVDKLIQSSQRPAPEEEARRRVLEKLAGISRLPPHHEALSTQVLLSIESMYAELLSASTDEARELCIRDSFPNPAQMSSALLALIELLDPSIDINDPVIRDADVDSLIKVVLFEERHRYEQAHPSLRPPPSPSPLPPPIASRRGAPGSVAPPPLPRAGSMPPPLPPPGGEKRAR
jgi:hypothetical protein